MPIEVTGAVNSYRPVIAGLQGHAAVSTAYNLWERRRRGRPCR